jgi:hypothetical protein
MPSSIRAGPRACYLKPDRLILVLYTGMAGRALRPSETAVLSRRSPDPPAQANFAPPTELLVTDALTQHEVTVNE